MSLCRSTIRIKDDDGTIRFETYPNAFSFQVPEEGDIRCQFCERKLLEVPFPTKHKVHQKAICCPRKGMTNRVMVTLCICNVCEVEIENMP